MYNKLSKIRWLVIITIFLTTHVFAGKVKKIDDRWPLVMSVK